MGFNVRKAFHTDKRAETEGRKLILVPDADPAKASWLLIARKTSKDYKEYVSKVLQENQALLQTKTPEAEVLAQGIFKDAAARHLLIGWQHIDWEEVKDGVLTVVTDVRHSVEQARLMFEENDFYKMVDDFAGEMHNYRAEEVAKEEKNLATT